MSKVFLIDVAMQWGMLKKHYDRNIGPLYHAFTLNKKFTMGSCGVGI
jgi:hypothetical protein